MSSIFHPSQEHTNGARLARLLIDGGTQALRDLLHSFIPSSSLRTVLNNNSALLQNLKKKGKLFDGQWEKLFPSSGDPPDSKTFDITLLHLLLREICHLIEPVTGWHTMPADTDNSREANVVRIKCFRNELCHSISTGIPNCEFEDKWNKISRSLVALGLDQQEIDRFKMETIDHDTKQRVEEEVQKWKLDFEPRFQTLEQEVQQLKVNIQQPQSELSAPRELSNCLPDEISDVFGRSQEIEKVIEAVQSGTVSIAFITGGPGFGKTTVANKVAHELAKPEYCRSVLCCSLASKATLDDIATTIILTCSKNNSQPPENPQHWLLNWSKQQPEKVTFLLDNADDVLDSDIRDKFLKMLREMRALSRQNLTFVITSRKTVNVLSDDFKIIRLTCLSLEEASNLLLSKVHSDETRQKLSQTTKIVALCGGVPLALCIVGSLLSDYKEDRLIQSLEKQPLDVLQDDEISLENTINTSYALLTQLEQEALAILSVFPGSFDSDAAEAAIAAGTATGAQLVVRILRSLKNRSLLEQPSSCRYEVHQLIQAFVNKVSQSRHSQALVQGKKMACAHFISRLADNANMYWSKDKCKESVDAFNEDRHNFEYFLHIYIDVMEKRDVDYLQSSTSKFLDNFPQKCMYLEMCLLPSVYIMILERLLKYFETESRPIHTLELLCLLGHEKRKVGNQAQYEDLMKKAKRVYARNNTEFATSGLSRVYFANSYSRYLFERKLPWELINEADKIALNVCRENLNEHPEAAATWLFIGRHQKSMQHLQAAMDLFKCCLGEHFMTAQALKAIADFYFSDFLSGVHDHRRNTGGDLDKSFEHYGEALAMMEKLGMGSHKESILSLKNYGLCHKLKGNFQAAIDFLEKAKRVAEIELEDDHKWKVMIETQLAPLYGCVGRVEEAKAVMKKGIEMNQRLGQSIGQLANRVEIKRFLARYQGGVGVADDPRPGYVPPADDSWTTVGRDPRNRPIHCEQALREGSRGHAARERSSGNRYSLLAEGENFSAPIGQKEFCDYVHQKSCSTLSRAGRPKNVQSREHRLPVRPETQPKMPASTSQYFAGIQDELSTLMLEKKARNEQVFEWINENVFTEDTKKASFIRALVTVVCEETMDRDERGHCTCNISRLGYRKNLLQKYVDEDTYLELEALYAVQALFVQLDHPPGFIKSYFDSFYDEEIVTEESFNAWESSSKEENGKGVALAASSEFFRWLKSVTEEAGELES